MKPKSYGSSSSSIFFTIPYIFNQITGTVKSVVQYCENRADRQTLNEKKSVFAHKSIIK
jgi:hypothetical protein